MCVGGMVPSVPPGNLVPLVCARGLALFVCAGRLGPLMPPGSRMDLLARVSAVVDRWRQGLPMVFMGLLPPLLRTLYLSGWGGTAMPSRVLMPWHGLGRFLLALWRQQGLLEAPWPSRERLERLDGWSLRGLRVRRVHSCGAGFRCADTGGE